MSVTIDDLYKFYNILADAKDAAGQVKIKKHFFLNN